MWRPRGIFSLFRVLKLQSVVDLELLRIDRSPKRRLGGLVDPNREFSRKNHDRKCEHGKCSRIGEKNERGGSFGGRTCTATCQCGKVI